MTETGMSCSNPLHANAGLALLTAATRVEVRIVDEDGTELSQGEIGSLEVKGIMFSKAIGNCPKKLRPSSMTNGLSLATWLLV